MPTGSPRKRRSHLREKSVSTPIFFVEYVGDYPDHSASQFLLNSGGAWRFTRTQQLDFHVAIGLNNSAPHYIFGLGYSLRFDGLFGSK